MTPLVETTYNIPDLIRPKGVEKGGSDSSQLSPLRSFKDELHFYVRGESQDTIVRRGDGFVKNSPFHVCLRELIEIRGGVFELDSQGSGDRDEPDASVYCTIIELGPY